MTRTSKVTIGQIATALLLKGNTAQQTLDKVRLVFPNCQTTLKCIYYYASKAGVALRQTQEIDAAELAKVLAEVA